MIFFRGIYDRTLNNLFEEQEKLKEKPFNVRVIMKMESNRKRIHFLIKKQTKIGDKRVKC